MTLRWSKPSPSLLFVKHIRKMVSIFSHWSNICRQMVSTHSDWSLGMVRDLPPDWTSMVSGYFGASRLVVLVSCVVCPQRVVSVCVRNLTRTNFCIYFGRSIMKIIIIPRKTIFLLTFRSVKDE